MLGKSCSHVFRVGRSVVYGYDALDRLLTAVTTGSSSVVVAVIDTGADYSRRTEALAAGTSRRMRRWPESR